MAHRISGYVEADGRERSDFPIACDACLGDNPHIRMLRDNLHEFVTEPEREDREGYLAKLQDREDWLYEDAEHETKEIGNLSFDKDDHLPVETVTAATDIRAE
ncbi:hypothetical protein CTI12_AA336370 [Artemisia annua]|uniref:Uncharacterized protein n=1 Tax=Artemisia annua TaxID=35608 RepID=A0A2U1MW24_ARTAN|nr:hypothetical protein CTI12_AA336370 [Artemisia annua]